MGKFSIGTETQIGTAVTGTVAASVAAVAIPSLQVGALSARFALLQLVKQAGTDTVTLPAPVKLIGTCKGRRVLLGILNAGAAIVLSADAGYQELVQGLGLCTAAVVIPGGALTGGGAPAYDAFVAPVHEDT